MVEEEEEEVDEWANSIGSSNKQDLPMMMQ